MSKENLYYRYDPIEKFKTRKFVDIITDYGKGIICKSVDGREWATMEQVEQVNKEYCNSIMIEQPKCRAH